MSNQCCGEYIYCAHLFYSVLYEVYASQNTRCRARAHVLQPYELPKYEYEIEARPTDRPTDGRPDGRRDLKMFSGLAMLRACTYGNLLQRQPSSQAGLAGQASRARNSFLPASLNRLQGRSVRTTGMAYLYGLVQTMARPARDGFEFVGGTDGGGRGFSCTKCSSSQRLLLSICICEGKIRRAELRKKNNRVR